MTIVLFNRQPVFYSDTLSIFMKSTIFFQTNSTLYMYDNRLQNYTIAHPLMLHFYTLDQQGRLPSDFSLVCENDLPKDYNDQDRMYYFEKYLHFKKTGYFMEEEKTIRRQYTVQNIERAFYNADNVVFEATDACNLKCKYCGYGDMYCDYDERKNRYMKFDTVRCVLDNLCKFWESGINSSSNKSVLIGFYGGEPLLNFQLIKDTIEYLNLISLPNIEFQYNMTTNATMLYKHIDFLVKNNFRILVSLDGTEYNHSYRVFHNGKNSHSKVLSDIKKIMNQYPQFYKEKINFNAVLHDRNSVEAINDFIQTELGKIPKINQLNNSGIKDGKKEEFAQLFNSYFKSVSSSRKQDDLINDRFIDDANVHALSSFLRLYNSNQFDSYINFFNKLISYSLIQTGTCVPFEKKIYVTVNNKILACERISQKYILGKIENMRVVVDFEQIVKIYDTFLENIYRLCKNCYRSGKCNQCIFQFEEINEETVCWGFQNEAQFSDMIGRNVSFLEKYPTLFNKLIREVFIQ